MPLANYKEKPKTNNTAYYIWRKNSGPVVHIMENHSDGSKSVYTSKDIE